MSTVTVEGSAGLLAALRANIGWVIGVGWLVLIAGILSVLAPLESAIAITVVVGVLLIIRGVSELAFVFRAGAMGHGWMMAITGAIATLIGVLFVAQPLRGVIAITLLIAAYFVAVGILAIVFAFRLRPHSGWGWMLANGIITLVLGALIWQQWPLSGTWAIGVLFGVQLISSGIALITIGSALKRGLSGAAAR
jgi:uncharacterized membrane protein HdeD (DUF308 family)